MKPTVQMPQKHRNACKTRDSSLALTDRASIQAAIPMKTAGFAVDQA
jgi:hypothetical protein